MNKATVVSHSEQLPIQIRFLPMHNRQINADIIHVYITNRLNPICVNQYKIANFIFAINF